MAGNMGSLFSPGETAGITLSQLTAAITNTVARSSELSGVWVTAELSDVRVAGGHCYMELIEKNEAGQTVAKLRATIWKSIFLQLRQKFYQATQKDISTGIKVLVRGNTTHHSLYGLSFNIYDIDPSYTVGDIERLRREIILRLQKEGIAEQNKKIAMPLAPQRIAVISASGAAGYGDFINQLVNNSEGFVFYPCLFPCVMQGDKVSESVQAALQLIESTADLWDCVAIVRGGGATTDLIGFDDYALARAVALCGLPVVVGIGHDRDRNVLDEIAHTSVKTPTAVAAFFIDQARQAYDRVTVLTDRIRTYISEMLRGEERRLGSIQSLIPQLALRRLSDSRSRLQNIMGQLPLLSQGRVGNEGVKINGLVTLLGNVSHARIEKELQKVKGLESLTKVLNPQNTLQRGYSITRINGKAVKSIEDLKAGDEIISTFNDGEARSVVK